MKPQKETILDRNEVFHRIFEGKRIKQAQMFSTIRAYSPSGIPRSVPHTDANVSKYNAYVMKRQMREMMFK